MAKIRSSVTLAIEKLEKAGYTLQGEKEVWEMALHRLSNSEIGLAVQLVMEQHHFLKVLPATLVQALQRDSGSRKSAGLDPAKWQMWKDDQGRDHAFHPDSPYFREHAQTERN